MTYELWLKTSRNIIAAFETERGALEAVRQAVETNGRAYAETLAVIREDTRGRSKPVAEGAALVERALAAAGQQSKPKGASPRAAAGGRQQPVRV